MNYPIELKMKVLSEYEQGKVGYKWLARKYSLKRDTVRQWVLANEAHMKIEEKIETEEKDIAYYKAQAEFWKTYAEKLEEERFGISSKKNKDKDNKGVSREEEIKDKPSV
ncbi:MAG: hypothetical protein KBT11_08430 [Treponema sp.]|nr:hypothetical protein [Candidatus Treponema equifaecale]